MTKEEIIAAIHELSPDDRTDIVNAIRDMAEPELSERMRAAAEKMKDYYLNDPEVQEWLSADMGHQVKVHAK